MAYFKSYQYLNVDGAFGLLVHGIIKVHCYSIIYYHRIMTLLYFSENSHVKRTKNV